MADWFYNLLSPQRSAPSAPVVQESVWDSPYDPDYTHSAAQMGTPYVRRLSTRVTRDLPQPTHEQGIKMAFWLSIRNPLAKAILRLTRDFVVGDGITVTAVDPEDPTGEQIEQLIVRFWGDERNQMDLRLHDMVRELGLFGEQIVTVFVNPKDGMVRLGSIDPEDVHDIICEAGNIEHHVAVEIKAPIGGAQKPRYKIVGAEEDPAAQWFGRLTGVQTTTDVAGNTEVLTTFKGQNGEDVPYPGACLHFAVNRPARTAKRGISDLLDAADWIDAYDQLLFGDVDRSLLMKGHIYDVSIDGDEQAVNKFMSENKTAPSPGSLRVHTNKVVWDAVTPDLKAHDTATVADLILSLIATSGGLPKTWLNGHMDVNRASATEMSEPSLKFLTERQRFVKFMLERLVTFVLDQAEIAGRLPKRIIDPVTMRPEPWPFVVQAPEIATKDLKPLANIFTELVQALSVALADGAIDIQLYQDLMAHITGLIGYEVDLDQLRERMEEAKAEEAAQAAEAEPEDEDGEEAFPGMEQLAILARGR